MCPGFFIPAKKNRTMFSHGFLNIMPDKIQAR